MVAQRGMVAELTEGRSACGWSSVAMVSADHRRLGGPGRVVAGQKGGGSKVQKIARDQSAGLSSSLPHGGTPSRVRARGHRSRMSAPMCPQALPPPFGRIRLLQLQRWE